MYNFSSLTYYNNTAKLNEEEFKKLLNQEDCCQREKDR